MLDYNLHFKIVASQSQFVMLFGKIGHCKTRLLNTLCRTEFSSPKIKPETVWKGYTCMQLMQVGYKPKSGICVMDKPGWDDDDMIMFNLQQYKCILWGSRHLGSFSTSAAPCMPSKNMCCKDASHCACCADKKPFSVQFCFVYHRGPSQFNCAISSVVRRAHAIAVAILHFCRRMVFALRFHQWCCTTAGILVSHIEQSTWGNQTKWQSSYQECIK